MTRERGSILLLFVFCLIPLLLVVGLAVDSGNLYRAKLALQGAADATALATVNYVVLKGETDFRSLVEANGCPVTFPSCLSEAAGEDGEVAAINHFLDPYARDLARANLIASGYPHNSSFPVTVKAKYIPGSIVRAANPSSESAFDYEVTLNREIDFYIMDLIPSFGLENRTLSATASSRRKIAKISLIVDVSDSMTCPAEGGCECKLPSGGVCTGDTRFDKLIDSVKEFLRMFNLESDVIHIVPFNIAASPYTLDELREAAGLSKTKINNELIEKIGTFLQDENIPVGGTNISDGFIRSWAWMKKSLDDDATLSHDGVTYVFFSDGAPTAGRFLFDDTNGLPLFNAGEKADAGYTLGNYDYIHYTLTWRNAGIYRIGPSLLFQTGYFGLGFGTLDVPFPGGLDFDPSAAIGNCAGSPSTAPPVTADTPDETAPFEDASAAAEAVFSPCLNTLKLHLPSEPAREFGSEIPFGDWRKLYYVSAIEMADYMRDQGGTVYVVGLGERWTPSPCPTDEPECNDSFFNDPYENINSILFRKDIFLSRIALDPIIASQYIVPGSDPAIPIEFSYAGYRDYSTWKSNAPARQGTYFPTSDADSIKLLFNKVARKVLLQLVS